MRFENEGGKRQGSRRQEWIDVRMEFAGIHVKGKSGFALSVANNPNRLHVASVPLIAFLR